nr:uncharacterized protein LOC126534663 [Dermacentor andersoni]
MLVRCSLYRKQIDVCYECGRLGHRADVCPNPNDKICRGCGRNNPAPDHRCEPRCRLCGKGHFMGDRRCKRPRSTSMTRSGGGPGTAAVGHINQQSQQQQPWQQQQGHRSTEKQVSSAAVAASPGGGGAPAGRPGGPAVGGGGGN